jgi:hypothetical protein
LNLSISESDDNEGLGFPSWQVNRMTLQVVAALFGQGAGLVFGHDWREDGVMEAVYGFARQMQSPIPLSDVDAATEAQPLLRNLLPWPERPFLPAEQLEQLNSTLRVEPVGLPNELRASAEEALLGSPDNDLFRYIRARGLTFLRHRLNDVCDARLCIGGRRTGAVGRYPGVIEEALFAIRGGKPLYLAGLLGGATAQIIDAIEGRPMPEDFCHPTSLLDIYHKPPVDELDEGTRDDRVIAREAVWKEFAEAGRTQLARLSGLKADEIDFLLHTPVIDQVIELVLIGLSRLCKSDAKGKETEE